MKEFAMNDYTIRKLNGKGNQSGGIVNVEIGIEMEYMVSFWYIGKVMSDDRNDFLFYNDDSCLYVEDANAEGVTGKGDGTKETNGIKLAVYGEIIEGEDKDELIKEMI